MAYSTISVEGGLFPADLLERIATGRVEGQTWREFFSDQAPSGRLGDEIEQAFSDVREYWNTFQRRQAYSHESLTSLTRGAWIIPLLERLGFELVHQPSATVVGGESYFVSHRAGSDPDAPPVHIVGIDQSLDQRGEWARRSPHALVQEFLNRSDALWGIATNGRQLRLLRDLARLSRPTYVELDLEALVQGNLYSEFVLFSIGSYIDHGSRVAAPTRRIAGWRSITSRASTRVGGYASGCAKASRQRSASWVAPSYAIPPAKRFGPRSTPAH